jgi:hypothetical protein
VAPSAIFSSAPMLCLTPLYHFSSDTSELVIDGNIRVCRFDECRTIPFDDDIAKHLRVHEPDYLLCHAPVSQKNFEDFKSLLVNEQKVLEKRMSEVSQFVLAPTAELCSLLRLFKPGRLRAGETFFLFRTLREDYEKGVIFDEREGWQTASYGHVAAVTVDYTLLLSQTTSYVLNSAEVPFLQSFRDNVAPVLRNIGSFPTVANALLLYAADNGEQLDAVGAVTALEGLLTEEGDIGELAYRLSMRVANLLGQNIHDKKRIFREVRNFYKLRSKIVHGAELDLRLRSRLNELDSLRETLRRVLLSVMALFSEGTRPASWPELLDDLAFEDDEKRKEVQKIAEKFLHISADKEK